ncbi:MAG: hypothetical protein M1344_03285 [Candidatus Thermoplasmatota archaeon]|nr:hypothetical protein [Candidatus Thermoplasmatota archaeon]
MTTTDLMKIARKYKKNDSQDSLDIFSREGDLEPDDRIKDGNVILPFQGRFRDSLLTGQKICTSRFRKHGLPGQRFIAFGHVFKIRKLERWTLGDVASKLFRQEGLSSPSEFWEIWRTIHPGRNNSGLFVWVHFFEEVDKQ